MSVVRLFCYVPIVDDGRKVYHPNRINLGKDFVLTVREFNTKDLVVSDIRKYHGSMFNPVWVIGVFNVSSRDPTPFFIKEIEVKALKEKIQM